MIDDCAKYYWKLPIKFHRSGAWTKSEIHRAETAPKIIITRQVSSMIP